MNRIKKYNISGDRQNFVIQGLRLQDFRSGRNNPLCMRSMSLIFDDGTGPNLIRADVLSPGWLDSILQPVMLEIRGASDINLTIALTITLHLPIDESRTYVTFSVVDKLFIAMLLRKTFTDHFIGSVLPADRKIVLHSFPQLPS